MQNWHGGGKIEVWTKVIPGPKITPVYGSIWKNTTKNLPQIFFKRHAINIWQIFKRKTNPNKQKRPIKQILTIFEWRRTKNDYDLPSKLSSVGQISNLTFGLHHRSSQRQWFRWGRGVATSARSWSSSEECRLKLHLPLSWEQRQP